MFFLGLGERAMPGSVVGCVGNMIKTMVFIRFRFFTYLMNWVIFNRLLGAFFDKITFLICFDMYLVDINNQYLVNIWSIFGPLYSYPLE